MATKPSRWTDRRRRVQEDAEALARRFSDTLPANLGDIAREQKVREIDFRPLIVDGGLSFLDDGFLISVRCEESDADRFRRHFKDDPTGRELPARARFTIAHEIGHTLFFDLKSSPPTSAIDYKDRRTLPSLEDACSRAAGQLLLPEFILQRDFKEADLLSPDTLRNLSDLAVMSPAAVVVRLANLSRFPPPYGIIVCLERVTAGFAVQTVARHEGFRDVFLDIERGAIIRSLLPDLDFIFSGGKQTVCAVAQSVAGRQRDYVVTTESEVNLRRPSYFLTIARSPESD
jgi:hypothetical protein